jgi:hypothetical protein
MSILKISGLGGWASAAALAMAVLSGCGGSSSSPAIPANHAPVIAVMLSGMVDPGTAGADVTASAGSILTLSASSTDADGDLMTFKWTLTSKPATSNLSLTADTSGQQAIKPDVAGTYVINLRVTDSKGAYSEKSATVLVRDNAAPVTNIAVAVSYSGQITTKPTQTLNTGSSVVLDASASTDADGDVVSTSWTVLEKPATSAAALTVEGATARFVADVDGVFKVRARGTDPLGAYSDTVYVFEAKNSAPQTLVLASVNTTNISVAAGYAVSINGSLNYDPQGGQLSYAWTLDKPAGSQAWLAGDATPTNQIVPDVLGDYVVKLTLTNADGASSVYTTVISVTNRRPVAFISSSTAPMALPTGPSIRLPVNTLVTLRGTNSVDADGDALTYAWTLSSKPAGSAAAVSAADGTTVQLTVDRSGTYQVTLRVTDAAGAYSEQMMQIEVGNYAPVAVIDRSRVTVLLGSSAGASAALSFDEDRDTLTYAWAIDARPASSTATIAAPTSSTLAFTPDVAGTYVASVTVSDGISTNVSYVTINALSSFAATVSLPFVPLDTRYSRGLDKMIIVATNPNALKIVDPFSGLIKTVILPAGAISMNLSPDGKLAAVLSEGLVSLVDLESASLLHTSLAASSPSEAFASNAGRLYLTGSTGSYGDGLVKVLDGRTGADLSSTLGMSASTYYNVRGVFAGTKGRALAVSPSQSSYYMQYFDIDAATGKVNKSGNSSYSNYSSIGTQLFLSENEDLVFTNVGTFYRTDTLAYAGKLVYTGTMNSLSNSSSADETLLMLTTQGSWPDYAVSYSASYKRYVGALFLADTDLTLPTIGGLQSYGINIFHSANGKQVALVQTGSSTKFGAGTAYYVLTR